MNILWQDLKYAVQMLRRNPGFTLVVVFTLALGIGANTTIFSILDAVYLRPLPYDHPDRLIWLWGSGTASGTGQGSVSPPDYLDYRGQNQSFENLAAFMNWPFNLTGVDEPERINGARVSSNYFKMFGAEPELGRAFSLDEEQSGPDQVVILTHGLWQQRFGGSPNVIGQELLLNGQSFRVIGVMPARFQFPAEVELWAPMTFGAQLMGGAQSMTDRKSHFVRLVGRLKSGVSIDQAQTEINAISRRLEGQYPDSNRDYGLKLVPLSEYLLGDTRATLWTLAAAVGFVLLIACANVASLLLARGVSRHREVALRAALGASRPRIIRQLLTESAILSVMGGVAALLLAWCGLKLFVALSSANLPRAASAVIDGRVLGFTLALSLVTAVLFGLIPALQISRPNLGEMLRESRKGSMVSVGWRARSALTIAEVALALLLLLGAGLMVQSFRRLSQSDPGFNPDRVLTMRFEVPRARMHQGPAVFMQQLLQSVASLPGVEHVGSISQLPLTGQNNDTSFAVEGRAPVSASERPQANRRVVTPDYFRVMGIPLVRGRYFTEQDVQGKPNVIIISETLARQIFPNDDPLGKRLVVSGETPWIGEIIGIVGSVRHVSLAQEPWRELYFNFAQTPHPSINLVVRTASAPEALARAIKGEISGVDKDLPIYNVRTMVEVMAESAAQPRDRALLLGVFAAVALILTAVGIYGLMSYFVTQRTQEIGIRTALGARPRDVQKLVISQGMVLTLIGMIIGMVASFWLTRLMKGLLFGITATDVGTFSTVSGGLILVTLLACYVPARRATKVDPLVALRYE